MWSKKSFNEKRFKMEVPELPDVPRAGVAPEPTPGKSVPSRDGLGKFARGLNKRWR